MDLLEIGCEGVNWILLAQDSDKMATCFEEGNEYLSSVEYVEFLDFFFFGATD